MHPTPFRLSVLTLLALIAARQAGADDKAGLKLTEEEKRLVELTNEARKKEGLPALEADATLFAVARAHSRNMAHQQEMNHVLDGKNPSQRVKEAGYRYTWTGENIAAGDGWTLPDVMQAWLDSPAHRKNILKKEYRQIGIGVARDADGKVYYTQVFGTPRPR